MPRQRRRHRCRAMGYRHSVAIFHFRLDTARPIFRHLLPMQLISAPASPGAEHYLRRPPTSPSCRSRRAKRFGHMTFRLRHFRYSCRGLHRKTPRSGFSAASDFRRSLATSQAASAAHRPWVVLRSMRQAFGRDTVMLARRYAGRERDRRDRFGAAEDGRRDELRPSRSKAMPSDEYERSAYARPLPVADGQQEPAARHASTSGSAIRRSLQFLAAPTACDLGRHFLARVSPYASTPPPAVKRRISGKEG